MSDSSNTGSSSSNAFIASPTGEPPRNSVSPRSRSGRLPLRPLGDIETCFEHPLREAIRICDLGRDDRVAVDIQILDVAPQAKITNLLPKAVKANLGRVCSFGHGNFLRSVHPSLRKAKASDKAGIQDYCPGTAVRIAGLAALVLGLKPRMSRCWECGRQE